MDKALVFRNKDCRRESCQGHVLNVEQVKLNTHRGTSTMPFVKNIAAEWWHVWGWWWWWWWGGGWGQGGELDRVGEGGARATPPTHHHPAPPAPLPLSAPTRALAQIPRDRRATHGAATRTRGHTRDGRAALALQPRHGQAPSGSFLVEYAFITAGHVA